MAADLPGLGGPAADVHAGQAQKHVDGDFAFSRFMPQDHHWYYYDGKPHVNPQDKTNLSNP